MAHKPKFSYFLATDKYPIRPAFPEWISALPITRTPPGQKPGRPLLTFGDYFNAVRIFLKRDQHQAVIAALYGIGRGNVNVEQIQAIRVFLVKHGQYYHPARIEIDSGKTTSLFVLNVAVSATARQMIKEEAAALNLLYSRFPCSFLPKVYAAGEVSLDDRRDFGMFLGQWFDDYHEFHLSRGNGGNQNQILVWDGKVTKYFLSPGQTRAAYGHAALILTAYYNIATFEHISAWHHAAGDFVINLHRDRLVMKLITVRRYTPLLDNVKPDVHLILEALQFFLLNLSLHMQLDRFDGVGDPVWAGDMAVAGSVDGFLKGLMMQVKAGLIPVEIVEGCMEYLGAVSKSEWIDMAASLVNRYAPDLPELPLIQRNLDRHAICLYKRVKDIDRYAI